MNISFIGAGNMASAIIKSIVGSGKFSPDSIYVFDKFPEKADELVPLGINKSDSLVSVCESGDIIFLAVKPQDYEAVLCDIKNSVSDIDKKAIISIAAGISCDFITKTLACDIPVVRVMPNTPIMLGMGATAISRNGLVGDKLYSKICSMFACCGVVCALDESLMNKVIAVNGSSPVFIYMLAKIMIENAVSSGIGEKMAKELVFQTIKGSVEMLAKTDKTPDELIRAVASPGGTTLEAIKVLEEGGFYGLFTDAMDACTKRADELSK